LFRKSKRLYKRSDNSKLYENNVKSSDSNDSNKDTSKRNLIKKKSMFFKTENMSEKQIHSNSEHNTNLSEKNKKIFMVENTSLINNDSDKLSINFDDINEGFHSKNLTDSIDLNSSLHSSCNNLW